MCDVCKIGDCPADNKIVYCDGPKSGVAGHDCVVKVHQDCYGIREVPKGKWYCATCAAGQVSSRVKCSLCPVVGGAMKAVKDTSAPPKGKPARLAVTTWVHVSCVLFIPETRFADVTRVEGVKVWRTCDRCSHACLFIARSHTCASVCCAWTRG